MLIVTEQKEVDKYFESERLSQSEFKKLLKGFSDYKSKIDKEVEQKESWLIGSAVDTILTGEEFEFDNQYYISQIETKPSEVERGIIDTVFKELDDNNIEIDLEFKDYSNMIEIAIEESGWQPRWKPETRLNKIIELGSEYFYDLVRGQGKTILSNQQYQLINKIVESLKTNEKTREFFDRGLFVRNVLVDIYYQLPIYFTYNDIECKALLDMLIIFRNPDTNKIESVQPVDLKTMSGYTIDFLKSVKSWRYDIQAAWYNLAIQHWMSENGFTLGEYILKPFQFVVESTTNIGNPLVFTMSEDLMDIGKSGRNAVPLIDLMTIYTVTHKNILISKEIKGYEQLVEEYKYYSENEWKEDKIITEGNGFLKLDWDGINLE